jgi:hypothetical protein
MAASSNKQMKDLLTDNDIYRVLDIEDESDVFSEESDDFWFDLSSLTTTKTWGESTGMMANCKATSWLENV